MRLWEFTVKVSMSAMGTWTRKVNARATLGDSTMEKDGPRLGPLISSSGFLWTIRVSPT